MARTKQPVCCARLQSRLHMDEAALRRLSQKAAMAVQRGDSLTKWAPLVADAKHVIQRDKEAIIDHDADHAA